MTNVQNACDEYIDDYEVWSNPWPSRQRCQGLPWRLVEFATVETGPPVESENTWNTLVSSRYHPEEHPFESLVCCCDLVLALDKDDKQNHSFYMVLNLAYQHNSSDDKATLPSSSSLVGFPADPSLSCLDSAPRCPMIRKTSLTW